MIWGFLESSLNIHFHAAETYKGRFFSQYEAVKQGSRHKRHKPQTQRHYYNTVRKHVRLRYKYINSYSEVRYD